MNLALDDGLATKWNNSIKVTTETTSAKNSTYLILAAERTHRKDPLDHFKYYTGGWNLTNPHYFFVSFICGMQLKLIFNSILINNYIAWSYRFINSFPFLCCLLCMMKSTGLASLGPFIVAILWFIVFGLWLCCMCICCCCCCCSRKPYGYSQTGYTLSLVFLCLFTLAVQ